MDVLALTGDGIGPEVMASALTVVGELDLGWNVDLRPDVNSSTWLETGSALPDDLIRDIQGGAYGAILFGAVGDPRAPEGVVERHILLRLRFVLDLGLNIRPLRLPRGVSSPLASGARIDAVVVRENTEGAYSGLGGLMRSGQPMETAVTVSVTTRFGVERALRHAVSLAERRSGRLTLVHKANVLQDEGGLWRRVAEEVASGIPGVTLSYQHADLAAMRLMLDPESYDVIVTDNLFGDLLTDLGAGLSGGIGLAPSANINPASGLALFEPVHGSAPDIAGRGVANPLAMIRCVGLAAEHVGQAGAAAVIEAATDAVAVDTDRRSTAEITDAVLAALSFDRQIV
ncbi:MAG: 3-isopropylmalate dehydrogenase [Pseudonocardiales bacterium]|nr:MAG: 3-isopropylmalate dehydrogenase [Pseudonocardiales bacterium]